MIHRAEVSALATEAVAVLLRRVGALFLFIKKRVEDVLEQGVAVLAVKAFFALLPTTRVNADVALPPIVEQIRALLRIVKVHVRCSPKVLLSVRVVALAPLVLGVNRGAKACLVAVDHKSIEAEVAPVLVQVHHKLLLTHQLAHQLALLGIRV